MEFMTMTGLRDLQWRARRFLIAATAAALVFAITLVLSGFLASFDGRADTALAALGGDGFVVPAGAAGPFRAPAPIPAALAAGVTALPGVLAAAPLITVPDTLPGPRPVPVLLIGHQPGRLGTPPVVTGRDAVGAGEAVLDESIGRHLNDAFVLGARRFVVVGLTRHQRIGAIPNLFIPIGDAQAVVFAGQPLATTLAVRGHPQAMPPGLDFVTRAAAKRDLLRPLADTISSIKTFRLLLWLVAGAIIGSVLYLSALDRARDFAVFKATGVATARLLGSLAIQSLIVSLAASVAGIALAYLIAPHFPVPVSLTVRIQMLLPAVAVVLGLVGSAAGLRRAVTVEPALAFGGH